MTKSINLPAINTDTLASFAIAYYIIAATDNDLNDITASMIYSEFCDDADLIAETFDPEFDPARDAAIHDALLDPRLFELIADALDARRGE